VVTAGITGRQAPGALKTPVLILLSSKNQYKTKSCLEQAKLYQPGQTREINSKARSSSLRRKYLVIKSAKILTMRLKMGIFELHDQAESAVKS